MCPLIACIRVGVDLHYFRDDAEAIRNILNKHQGAIYADVVVSSVHSGLCTHVYKSESEGVKTGSGFLIFEIKSKERPDPYPINQGGLVCVQT